MGLWAIIDEDWYRSKAVWGAKSQLAILGDPRLVIVRRGHFATFELLSRTFADDPSVQIVWDRRMGERRRSPTVPVMANAAEAATAGAYLHCSGAS